MSQESKAKIIVISVYIVLMLVAALIIILSPGCVMVKDTLPTVQEIQVQKAAEDNAALNERCGRVWKMEAELLAAGASIPEPLKQAEELCQ